MPAFYKASVGTFLSTPSEQISGTLSERIIRDFAGDESRQLAAWKKQIEILKSALRETVVLTDRCSSWGILFEYPMLRLQRRLDIALLAGSLIVVIEFKVGSSAFLKPDIQQVEDYALDLRDFHEASHDKAILPLLCATEAQTNATAPIPVTGVAASWCCNVAGLAPAFAEIAGRQTLNADRQIDFEAWDAAPYRPVPSIIEAAELLYAGHTVREIAHASSNPGNLSNTTDRLIEIIADAHRNSRHVVAFVTGVPGSGKTLAGLNAVHDPRFRQEGREAGAFLSGNTPLVTVLREALARDESHRTGKTLAAARRSVRAEIQGLMNYLEEYLDQHPNDAPVDHVIVFDEAQRAWDAAYGAQKFDRPKSEPTLFLEIMDRHPDWAVIVALVGGGQEINKGERGLSEWGSALEDRNANAGGKLWEVYAAPDVLAGGDATAWQRLFDSGDLRTWVRSDSKLHLPVSVRSYTCLATNQWVNAVLEGSADQAAVIAQEAEDFPIFLARSLDQARVWLKEQARGHRRYGLVASSGARRLRANGLGVSLSANELGDVANWYLLPRGDVRSSYALEVTANEYTCQGLELDYVGVCWGGDLIRKGNNDVWIQRQFRGTRWQLVQADDTKRWIMNKYRVLLTRARLGMVIWVPEGDIEDETRAIKDFNAIAEFLEAAGAKPL